MPLPWFRGASLEAQENLKLSMRQRVVESSVPTEPRPRGRIALIREFGKRLVGIDVFVHVAPWLLQGTIRSYVEQRTVTPAISTDAIAEASIFGLALISSIVWTAKTSQDWDDQHQANLNEYAKAMRIYCQTLADLGKQREEFDRRLADVLYQEGRDRTIAKLTIDVFGSKAADARSFKNGGQE